MRTSGYRIGKHPATYHQVNVARLQPGDVLYAVSKQDRIAYVVDGAPEAGEFGPGRPSVRVPVKCQGSVRDWEWHPSTRIAVLRKKAQG